MINQVGANVYITDNNLKYIFVSDNINSYNQYSTLKNQIIGKHQ